MYPIMEMLIIFSFLGFCIGALTLAIYLTIKEGNK